MTKTKDQRPNHLRMQSFTYQDYSYYLTSGSGPWGSRTWSYDKIGNRKTEVRGATTDTYSYFQVAGHDTSKLSSIAVGGGGGTKNYSYNTSGDGTGWALGATTTGYTVDDAHRMSGWGLTGTSSMSADYDGRGLLALDTASPGSKNRKESSFTFASSGVLMTRSSVQFPGATEIENTWYFSFAGLSVASWRTTSFSHGQSIDKFVVDHLGVPVAWATAAASNAGFEPFGADYAGNLTNIGTDHVFPGQTVDLTSQPSASLYYNVNRWYEPGTGRYSRLDPLFQRSKTPDYAYAHSNPMRWVDPLGLVAWKCNSLTGSWGPRILGTVMCESKCEGGSGTRVRAHFLLGGFGVSAGLNVTVEASKFELEDGMSSPDGANLNGPFMTRGCSLTIVAGGSLSEIQMGSGHGSADLSPTTGLGGGCFAFTGGSKMLDQVKGCCSRNGAPFMHP